MFSAVQGLQSLKLDGSALFSPSQHAAAGQAALALAQLTEKDSHLMSPSGEVMKFVSNLNHFAQKAETTRRILERYLIGTEVNRVDPVFVPFTPQTAQTYPVPASDRSVYISEHLPYNVNAPVTKIGAYQGMLSQRATKSGLPVGGSVLFCDFVQLRAQRIKSFI